MERKSRDQRSGEEKETLEKGKGSNMWHRRLHSRLEVLSDSLSGQFGAFLEASNLVQSQRRSHSPPFCSEGIY